VELATAPVVGRALANLGDRDRPTERPRGPPRRASHRRIRIEVHATQRAERGLPGEHAARTGDRDLALRRIDAVELTIDLRGRPRRARVVKKPIYKRED